MKDRLIQTSKFLSYVLRHKPEAIGLSLDKQGWADVEDLIAAACRNGQQLDRMMLQQVVEQNEKRRFTFSDDRRKIRANYGHSVIVALGLAPVKPPLRLYHGTAARFLNSIREQGLLRGKRQYVHLSPDPQTAGAVGKRHGKPVVLRIKSEEMSEAGYAFYRSANGVWLTERVPVEYILFPEDASKAGV